MPWLLSGSCGALYNDEPAELAPNQVLYRVHDALAIARFTDRDSPDTGTSERNKKAAA